MPSAVLYLCIAIGKIPVHKDDMRMGLDKLKTI